MTSFPNYLITHLTKLFDSSWEKQACISILLIRISDFSISKINAKISNLKEDFLRILVAKLASKANVENKTYFIFLAQLVVKKPKTYNKAINRVHAPQ